MYLVDDHNYLETPKQRTERENKIRRERKRHLTNRASKKYRAKRREDIVRSNHQLEQEITRNLELRRKESRLLIEIKKLRDDFTAE